MAADAQAEWAEWLRTKKWDYWVTGVFQYQVSEAMARMRVREWLADAQRIRDQVYGLANQVYAVATIEWGDMHGGIHAHLLVGGLGGHPQIPAPLVRAWPWGNLLMLRYDAEKDPRGHPRGGASAYIVKHLESVEIIGRLQKYRPRRRDKADHSY